MTSCNKLRKMEIETLNFLTYSPTPVKKKKSMITNDIKKPISEDEKKEDLPLKFTTLFQQDCYGN